MRTLVGAVAYRNLRDHSAPFAVLERLERQPALPGVVLEDTSYNPVAVVQWLQEGTAEVRFDRVIFVASVERGRRAGEVTAYRWDAVLPPDDQVQEAVAEAVTGVIALENTVVIAGYFKALPRVAIVEIEPLEHAFGDALSRPVQDAVERAAVLVARLAHDRDAFDALPVHALPPRHDARARA